MVYKVEERTERVAKPATTGECRHHWIIESARGPISHGVCKICGVQKDFLNSIPEIPMVRRRPPVTVFPEFAEEDEPEEELVESESEEVEAEPEAEEVLA